MADVRKEGNYYVTLRRIYTEQKPGEKGRALLYPVGRRLKEEEVKSLNLVVEGGEKKTSPSPKGRKAK
jgi:hypothetical protein